MKISELFSDESRWTRGAWARRFDGTPTLPYAESAAAWCLVGAINKCYPHPGDYTIFDAVKTKLYGSCVGVPSVAAWNDCSERTFTEVKNLVEQLDI